MSDLIERGALQQSDALEGIPAFYVDPGLDVCRRCGDTNYDSERICLTCTYPEHSLSRWRWENNACEQSTSVSRDGSQVIVDTAALAAHLGRDPSYIRWLARKGIITPVTRIVVGKTGRPSMHFDIAATDAQIAAWRTQLDQAVRQVRK